MRAFARALQAQPPVAPKKAMRGADIMTVVDLAIMRVSTWLLVQVKTECVMLMS